MVKWSAPCNLSALTTAVFPRNLELLQANRVNKRNCTASFNYFSATLKVSLCV